MTQIRLVGSVAFLLMTLGAPGLPVEEKVTEGRRHFTVVRADGMPAGSATRVVRFTSTWSSLQTLFESSTGDALVLEDRTDFAKRTMEWTVRNMKGDAWITLRMKLPFSGKTREEADAEAQATRMEIWKLMPDEIEIETNSGSWKGSEAEWTGSARLELTKQLRRGTSFDLLESIERNAGSAFVKEDEEQPDWPILDYLLYRPVCSQDRSSSKVAVPDCDFDERFGFPCSDKQLEKVKRERENSEPIERY